MLVAKCINKVRDNNGKIKAYILQDMKGNVMPVDGNQIKAAIRSGKANITNLQIDSIGRLVDKQEEKVNNIDKCRQAEIIVKLLATIKEIGNEDRSDFDYKLIKDYNSNMETKYIKELERIGLYEYDRRSRKKDISDLGMIFINYCENNLKSIEFCYFDCRDLRHEYDLLHEGYTYEEVKEMVDDEINECGEAYKNVEELIKLCEKEYRMKVNYDDDGDGYITITGIKFM